MPEWIEIGTIVAAQGLNGEIRIYPNSDFPERFLEPGQRWLLPPGQTDPQPVELLEGRYIPGKGIYVVTLAGIENREQVEALRGSQLLITDQDRPHLEEDEFYVLDLLGLEVFHQINGQRLGKIINIIPAGNDLLEVELDSALIPPEPEPPNPETPSKKHNKKQRLRTKTPKPKTLLIPFVKEIVPVVDLSERRVEVNPPKGLIDSISEVGEGVS